MKKNDLSSDRDCFTLRGQNNLSRYKFIESGFILKHNRKKSFQRSIMCFLGMFKKSLKLIKISSWHSRDSKK